MCAGLVASFRARHDKRIVGLDIIRAFAIVVVVHVHGRTFIPASLPVLRESNFLIDGVSVFFVLSGYLIGKIILDTLLRVGLNSRHLFMFWVRRWFRTIPNYFLVMGVVTALAWLFERDTLKSLTFPYLFFSQNLFAPHPHFFPEAWSLTIEEWFYVLFPATVTVLVALSGNAKRAFLLGAAVFLVFPLALRIALFESGYGLADYDTYYRKIVAFRLDSIMHGVLGAYVASRYDGMWRRYKKHFLVLSACLFGLLIAINNRWISIYFPFFYNLESVIVLCALPYFSTLASTRNRILDTLFVFLSVISYSMYLLNYTIVLQYGFKVSTKVSGAFGVSTADYPFVDYLLFWTYTIVLATLLYVFFEKPMTNLRERFSANGAV